MLQTDNITFVLSGGQTNTDPDQSLGGFPSNTGVIGGMNNNLFDDLTEADLSGGFTDYRCFYVFNDDPIDALQQSQLLILSQIAGGATAFLGVNLATDVQSVVILNINSAPASMTLSYEGNRFTVNKSSSVNQWAANFQSAINSFGLLSGVAVSGNLVGNQLTFTITFLGTSDHRNHELLQQTVVDSNVVITKITEGAPINFIPDKIGYNTTPPAGVMFTSNAIAIGTLNPGDGIPIWAQRVTDAGTQPIDLDGFTVRLTGLPAGADNTTLILASAILTPSSNLSLNGSVLMNDPMHVPSTANLVAKANTNARFPIVLMPTSARLIANATTNARFPIVLLKTTAKVTLSKVTAFAVAKLQTTSSVSALALRKKFGNVNLSCSSKIIASGSSAVYPKAVLKTTSSIRGPSFVLFPLQPGLSRFGDYGSIQSIGVHPTLDRVYVGSTKVTQYPSDLVTFFNTYTKSGVLLSSISDGMLAQNGYDLFRGELKKIEVDGPAGLVFYATGWNDVFVAQVDNNGDLPDNFINTMRYATVFGLRGGSPISIVYNELDYPMDFVIDYGNTAYMSLQGFAGGQLLVSCRYDSTGFLSNITTQPFGFGIFFRTNHNQVWGSGGVPVLDNPFQGKYTISYYDLNKNAAGSSNIFYPITGTTGYIYNESGDGNNVCYNAGSDTMFYLRELETNTQAYFKLYSRNITTNVDTEISTPQVPEAAMAYDPQHNAIYGGFPDPTVSTATQLGAIYL